MHYLGPIKQKQMQHSIKQQHRPAEGSLVFLDEVIEIRWLLWALIALDLSGCANLTLSPSNRCSQLCSSKRLTYVH